MIRPMVLVVGSALLVSGCANSVDPVSIKLSENRPQIALCESVQPAPNKGTPPQIFKDVEPRAQLQWLTCALREKANANLAQAQRWENRTEWRDIPLIGAATTVAGLLLFGKRDADNSLKKGQQDTIAALGFGSAAFATFANYLSPQNARTLLRQAARGHYCMATQGDLILSVYDGVDRSDRRDALFASVTILSSKIAKEPDKFTKLDEVRSIRDAANLALGTYDKQKRQLNGAAIALGETAWNFGIDLMTRSDRSEQKVDALVQAITAQTESVVKFSATEQKATDPVPAAIVGDQVKIQLAGGTPPPANDQLALDVAMQTAVLLNDLVNIEALVIGFDNCAATALAGGAPKASRIQRTGS